MARSLGVDTPRDVSSFSGFQLDPDALAGAMRAKLYDHVELGNNPRCAPSEGVTLCTYNNWFRGTRDYLHHHILSTSIPAGQHVNLVRFRLGCADLAANNGRRSCAKNRVPRGDRVCTLPNCGGIEDELHAIFECKANTHIRLSSKYSGLFENVQTGDMRAFFNGPNQ